MAPAWLPLFLLDMTLPSPSAPLGPRYHTMRKPKLAHLQREIHRCPHSLKEVGIRVCWEWISIGSLIGKRVWDDLGCQYYWWIKVSPWSVKQWLGRSESSLLCSLMWIIWPTISDCKNGDWVGPGTGLVQGHALKELGLALPKALLLCHCCGMGCSKAWVVEWVLEFSTGPLSVSCIENAGYPQPPYLLVVLDCRPLQSPVWGYIYLGNIKKIQGINHIACRCLRLVVLKKYTFFPAFRVLLLLFDG